MFCELTRLFNYEVGQARPVVNQIQSLLDRTVHIQPELNGNQIVCNHSYIFQLLVDRLIIVEMNQ